MNELFKTLGYTLSKFGPGDQLLYLTAPGCYGLEPIWWVVVDMYSLKRDLHMQAVYSGLNYTNGYTEICLYMPWGRIIV